MNKNEKTNLIEGLRAVGFSDTQIMDFTLYLAGRMNIEEWKRKFEEEEKKKK